LQAKTERPALWRAVSFSIYIQYGRFKQLVCKGLEIYFYLEDAWIQWFESFPQGEGA